MKTLLILLFVSINSFATTIEALGGNWTQATSWNLNRVPQGGDTVKVPKGITTTVESNIQLGNIYLEVQGLLRFSGGKLSLGDSSKIVVPIGGMIIPAGSPSEQIRIGNALKWTGEQGAIVGPNYADYATPFKAPVVLNLTPNNPTRRPVSVGEQWLTVSRGQVTIKAKGEVSIYYLSGQTLFLGRINKPVTFLLPVSGVYVVSVNGVSKQLFIN